jgi:glycogen synthase
MKVVLLTNEYPPHVYGGAGVHLNFLCQEFAQLNEGKHRFQVICFGEQEQMGKDVVVQGVAGVKRIPFQDPRHEKVFDALYRNVVMAGFVKEGELVHCHTWYTHFAGCLLKQILDVPLVITIHSLEPHRPWKEEQLGSGYRASTWLEKTALLNADGVIAVSKSMKKDVHELYDIPAEKIRVIHNGIDVKRYRPTFDRGVLRSYGINPDKRFVLFVGRITHQKGILHLVDGLKYLASDIQVVLCAGAPDTEKIEAEMKQRVEKARENTDNQVIWISEFLPEEHMVVLYSHASLFVCPSVYEPFGIINLEAMACNTPVVAAEVGGIPEVVVHNETGLLVDLEAGNNSEPKNPEQFSRDLAAAINGCIHSPEKLEAMAVKARQRVGKYFSWESIARQTLAYYQEVITTYRRR